MGDQVETAGRCYLNSSQSTLLNDFLVYYGHLPIYVFCAARFRTCGREHHEGMRDKSIALTFLLNQCLFRQDSRSPTIGMSMLRYVKIRQTTFDLDQSDIQCLV